MQKVDQTFFKFIVSKPAKVPVRPSNISGVYDLIGPTDVILTLHVILWIPNQSLRVKKKKKSQSCSVFFPPSSLHPGYDTICK